MTGKSASGSTEIGTAASNPGQTQNHRLAGVVVAVMPVVVIGGRADPGAFEMAPPPATNQARVLNWHRIRCLWRVDGRPSHGEWHRNGSVVERGRQQQDGSRYEGHGQGLAHGESSIG